MPEEISIEWCKEPGCVLAAHVGAHMTADEQEARSLKYLDALKVVLLSSGRWAIWGMRTGELRIREHVEEEELKSFWEAQRAAEMLWEAQLQAKIREARARKAANEAAPSPKASLTLEDLFGPGKEKP